MKSFLKHLQENNNTLGPVVLPSETPGEPPSVGVRRGQVIQSGMGYPSYEEDPDFYKRMEARRAENRKGAADTISLTNYSRDAMRAIVPVLGEPLTNPDGNSNTHRMGTTTNYYSTNRETGIHTPGNSVIRLNTNDERTKQAWESLKSGKSFSYLSPIGIETLTHEVAHSKPTPESISKQEAYMKRPDKSGNAQNVPGEPPTEYLFSPDELGAYAVGLKTQIRQNLGNVVGPDTTPEQMRQWMDELKQMKDSGKSKSPPWPSKQWDYFRNSDQGTEAAIIAKKTEPNTNNTAVAESAGKYYKSFLQYLQEEGLQTTAGVGYGNTQYSFNVGELVKHTESFPTTQLSLHHFKDIESQIGDLNPEQRRARIAKADLQYPIIVMKHTDPETSNHVYQILDGTHRVAKALAAGQETINAKVVEPNQMEKFLKTDQSG